MKMNTNGMRTVVLAVCTLGASTLLMLAQEPAAPAPPPVGQQSPGGQYGHRDPAQMEARQLHMMTERLKLTPDQVTQVKAIEDSHRTQRMALRQDTTMQEDDKRTRMTTMRQESEGKIRAVLTEDQKPQYDAMLARQREHRGHRPDGAGGPPSQPAAPPQ